MLSQAFELCEDGNHLEALKLYDSVIQKDPQNINALINKAVTLQGLDKVNQAIRLYDKALKINPNNIDALINKGSALHTLEKYIEAIMYYDLSLITI